VRLVLGVIALLLVLALVSLLARQLLRGGSVGAVEEAAAAAAGASADAIVLPRLTTREDAQALQRQVLEDVNRAMQDAAAARASAEGQ
jgi:hypothetical protein